MFRNTAATLSLALAISIGAARNSTAQTPVRVSRVQLQTLQQRQAVTGSLRAVARGDVAALESGRLVELTARAGDSVKKGDVIAKIDARRLHAQASAAQADRRVAEAELKRYRAIAKQAAANLSRAEELIRQNAVSQQEIDRYRRESEVAVAEIEAAQRRIERVAETVRLLEVRLSDTTVVAPYDSSVVARHVEPGDWVQPGDRLLTLVSSGALEAWLEVPERFAAALQEADSRVVVRSSALEKQLLVLDTKRLADVNPRVRTIQLIATVENRDNLLAPGMSIEGFVPSGRQGEFMTVPKDALVRRSGQPTVFVVDKEKTAVQLPVRVLFETPNRIALASPNLSVGAQVIVEGNERLMPSQLVQVIAPTPEMQVNIASR